jgi:hypothetical protein
MMVDFGKPQVLEWKVADAFHGGIYCHFPGTYSFEELPQLAGVHEARISKGVSGRAPPKEHCG